eukprot:jgi/Mesen1/5793/ME000293S04943
MHDFCFTFPYGAILALGGVFGFLLKGSIPSLAGGGGSGALLLLAGYYQMNAFQKGSNSFVALVLELVISAALTGVMGKRYVKTSNIMPAGLIAALSAVMAVFYLYKLVTGGNKITKKTT